MFANFPARPTFVCVNKSKAPPHGQSQLVRVSDFCFKRWESPRTADFGLAQMHDMNTPNFPWGRTQNVNTITAQLRDGIDRPPEHLLDARQYGGEADICGVGFVPISHFAIDAGSQSFFNFNFISYQIYCARRNKSLRYTVHAIRRTIWGTLRIEGMPSQHVSRAARAVGFPPHWWSSGVKAGQCILHHFRPRSPIKPWEKGKLGDELAPNLCF